MKIGTLIHKTLVVTALLATLLSLTSCGKKSNSRVSTNEKGEILEISVTVQSETGEYDPAGAAAYVYFSHQSFALLHTQKMVCLHLQQQKNGKSAMIF